MEHRVIYDNPNIRRVFRFDNKRFVMPIRVVKEVHVTFNQFPFKTNVDNVVYTQDINRRNNSTLTPNNISSSGQDFPVWAWTENNERGYLTCFIGCEYFYPQYGSKLVVHSNTGSSINGIFRYMKISNLDFTRCWNVSDIKSLSYGFKDTPITDFSAMENWNLASLTSIWEAFSQLGNKNVEPFLKATIGHNVVNIDTSFYGNHYNISSWDAMGANFYWKLTTIGSNLNATFLPNAYYYDMTNWDLTEWNSDRHIFFSSDYYGTRVRKITTPILPLQTLPMKLPYTMYDMETEQAYTEIPLNLGRQLTLYKNKSDFGK